MANIYSYIQWRGDLDFMERPFCEVDNLILSELSYMDFAGIVPTEVEGGAITLEAAAMKFRAMNRSAVYFSGSDEKLPIVLPMAEAKRYKHLVLSNFKEVIDEQSGTEFSALHVSLEDGTTYVAFRGTGDGLIGWKEDFSMSFQLMPAQKLAADYLARTLRDPDRRYRIGGHSKGGNLAVYAAMLCPEEKQEQIMEVYNNDGPGMCDSIVDMEKYRRISSKVTRIVPEFSVIGTLFEHEKPTKIVASSESGFLQHMGTSWQVEGDHFCTVNDLSEKCKFFVGIFDTWIVSASMEQRETFTNDFFNALESSGIHSMSDLSQSGISEVETVLAAITDSEIQTKIVIGKFISSVVGAFGNIDYKQLVKTGNTIQGGICFVGGLYFMMAPTFASKTVGVFLGILALIWLGRKLLSTAFATKGDVSRQKVKVILLLVVMCCLSNLIAQTELIRRFTNLLVGIFFLVLAYQQLKKGFYEKTTTLRKAARIGTGMALLMLGIIPIVFLGLEFTYYAFFTGVCLFLYGLAKLIVSMYENGRSNISAP